jgi:hypothetical protein
MRERISLAQGSPNLQLFQFPRPLFTIISVFALVTDQRSILTDALKIRLQSCSLHRSYWCGINNSLESVSVYLLFDKVVEGNMSSHVLTAVGK